LPDGPAGETEAGGTPTTGSWWLGERRHGLVRHLIATTAGGYGVFLAIVVVFHTWLGSERGAITSALIGETGLAVAVLGLFAGLSRLRRRPRRSPSRSIPDNNGDATFQR
jgi:hypothetical protein